MGRPRGGKQVVQLSLFCGALIDCYFVVVRAFYCVFYEHYGDGGGVTRVERSQGSFWVVSIVWLWEVTRGLSSSSVWHVFTTEGDMSSMMV